MALESVWAGPGRTVGDPVHGLSGFPQAAQDVVTVDVDGHSNQEEKETWVKSPVHQEAASNVLHASFAEGRGTEPARETHLQPDGRPSSTCAQSGCSSAAGVPAGSR